MTGFVSKDLSAGQRYQTVFGWLSWVSVIAVLFVLVVFNKRAKAYIEV